MSEYYGLLIDGLSASLWYAFLGLFIGGCAVFYLNYRGYLNRKVWILKFFTRLYFVFFPITFGLFFWFSGSISSTVKLYEEIISDVISEIEEVTYPVFAEYVNERVNTLMPDEDIPTNEEIVARFMQFELGANDQSIYNYAVRSCLITILDISIGEEADKEQRFKDLSQGLSATAYAAGFKLLRHELGKEGSKAIKFLRLPIIFSFIASLFFPFMEIYLSNKHFPKQEKDNIDALSNASESLLD